MMQGNFRFAGSVHSVQLERVMYMDSAGSGEVAIPVVRVVVKGKGREKGNFNIIEDVFSNPQTGDLFYTFLDAMLYVAANYGTSLVERR